MILGYIEDCFVVEGQVELHLGAEVELAAYNTVAEAVDIEVAGTEGVVASEVVVDIEYGVGAADVLLLPVVEKD